ncbi:MAG: hypothetical protein AB8G96_13180 [Phycisphaerales bacterium]
MAALLVATAVGLAGAAGLGGLGGCATPVGRVEIAVREAESRRPIAGADVTIAPMYLMNPASGQPVNPIRRAPDAGVTDRFGIVRLDAPREHPFEIVLRRPFAATRRAIVEPTDHPASTGGASGWIPLPAADPSDETAIEAQVRPSLGG